MPYVNNTNRKAIQMHVDTADALLKGFVLFADKNHRKG
jgi:hypothetical protein